MPCSRLRLLGCGILSMAVGDWVLKAKMETGTQRAGMAAVNASVQKTTGNGIRELRHAFAEFCQRRLACSS